MTNQIMITLQQIKDNDPCAGGWRKVLKANGGKSADFSKPFPVSSIIDSNALEDTFWALGCLPEHDLLWRRYALWCALQVKDNTEDPRVHECLETVERFCDGEATEDELEMAYSAAGAATWSAVGTVKELATHSAAYAAAQSAEWSAQSAAEWSAADSAKWSALWSAAVKSVWSAVQSARSSQENKLREVLDTGACVLR